MQVSFVAETDMSSYDDQQAEANVSGIEDMQAEADRKETQLLLSLWANPIYSSDSLITPEMTIPEKNISVYLAGYLAFKDKSRFNCVSQWVASDEKASLSAEHLASPKPRTNNN